jgi:hypothetical protein
VSEDKRSIIPRSDEVVSFAIDGRKLFKLQLADDGTEDVSAGCRSDAQRIEELRALLNKPWVEGATFRREVTKIVNGEA